MKTTQSTTLRVAFLTGLFLLSFSTSLFGVRVQFDVRIDGQGALGAEVCMFRARGKQTPIRMWFRETPAHCLPADKVLAIPEGDWAFFARVGSSHVSAYPFFLTVTGAKEAGYKRVAIDAQPATLIDVSALTDQLGGDELLTLYFPSDPRLGPSFVLPVERNQTAIAVPFERMMVPLISRGGHVSAIGNAALATKGLQLDAIVDAEDSFDVLSWLLVPRDENRRHTEVADITIRSGDQDSVVHPMFRPLHHYDLVIFKDVARSGIHDVTMDVADTTGHPILRIPIVDPADGIARPGPVDLLFDCAVSARLDEAGQPTATGDDCDAWTADEVGVRPTVTFQLLRCLDARRCDLIENREADAAGAVRFDGLPPGSYLVKVLRRGRILGTWSGNLKGGESAEGIIVPDGILITGRIASGDTPVQALVRIEGADSSSGPDGIFTALLDREPGLSPIEVYRCAPKTRFTFWPSEPVMNGAFLSIEVPAGESIVKAVDKDSDDTIAGAIVEVQVFDHEEPGVIDFNAKVGVTDEKGEATVARMPLGRDFRLCVRASKYEEGCSEFMTARETAESEIVIALEKSNRREGRVLLSGPVRGGTIAYVSPQLGLTEMAAVEENGNFAISRPHSPPEYLVFASSSHPMFALEVPVPLDGGVIEITPPPAPPRSFEVRVASTSPVEEASLGLALGPFVIPQPVLSRHLYWRGSTPRAVRGETLVIADVQTNEQVTVMLCEENCTVPESPRDAFLIPQLAATFPRATPKGTLVVFQ